MSRWGAVRKSKLNVACTGCEGVYSKGMMRLVFKATVTGGLPHMDVATGRQRDSPTWTWAYNGVAWHGISMYAEVTPPLLATAERYVVAASAPLQAAHRAVVQNMPYVANTSVTRGDACAGLSPLVEEPEHQEQKCLRTNGNSGHDTPPAPLVPALITPQEVEACASREQSEGQHWQHEAELLVGNHAQSSEASRIHHHHGTAPGHRHTLLESLFGAALLPPLPCEQARSKYSDSRHCDHARTGR